MAKPHLLSVFQGVIPVWQRRWGATVSASLQEGLFLALLMWDVSSATWALAFGVVL